MLNFTDQTNTVTRTLYATDRTFEGQIVKLWVYVDPVDDCLWYRVELGDETFRLLKFAEAVNFINERCP